MTNLRNLGISLLAATALALPATAKSKAKAEVTCTDGTTSKAGRGACSHHGGVAEAKTPAKEEKSAKSKPRAESKPSGEEPESKTSGKPGGILGGLFGKKSEPAQGRSPTTSPRSSTREGKSDKPTAKCKDGTTSYSAHHSGTCSSHGGVAEWLDK